MLRSLSLMLVVIISGVSFGQEERFYDLKQDIITVAQEFSIPKEFLWALVQVQSGGVHRTRVGQDGALGLVGLRPDGSRPSLPLACALAQVDIDDAILNPFVHLRAAASLLRFYYETLAPTGNDYIDWVYAVTRFAPSDDPDVVYVFLEDLLGILSRGGLRQGDFSPMPFNPIPLPIDDILSSFQTMKYRGAEYPLATWSPAAECNYTVDGPRQINYVIVHVAQGSYAGTISWFKNCSAKATTHYVIRSSDGAVTQMVLEKDIAWHAGNWDYNVHSIGFEMEGYIDDPKWFTDALYSSAAKLTAYICDKYGIPKDRQHIIGHNEVPGCPTGNGGGKSCHTDPGPYWNWDKFMALVKGEKPPVQTTGDLTGFIREGDIYTGPNIVGADVVLSNGWATKTGSNGLYKFTGVPIGLITVTASAPGYKTKSDTKNIEAGILNWKSIALEKETCSCAGKECGDNGCGGSCGECPQGFICQGNKCIGGQCKPDCNGKECGPDGCNGTCGECPKGKICDGKTFKCICIPMDHKDCCDSAVCWYDGCGGVGDKVTDCPYGCKDGKCLSCKPNCGFKECGDDGCGGSCGVCGEGQTCIDGVCSCQEKHHKGCCDKAICWYDSCGAKGEKIQDCPSGCQGGKCIECVPNCSGKECGNDGCGGSCGVCKDASECIDGKCITMITENQEIQPLDLPIIKDANLDVDTAKAGKGGGGCSNGMHPLSIIPILVMGLLAIYRRFFA